MAFPLNDLGSALTGQIYQSILGGGDGKVAPDPNTFFTWCMPGLPFSESDLDFCGAGIFSAKDAETQNERLMHAYQLSALLDFVPDVGAAYTSDKQQGMYKPDAEKHLSEMYHQILKFSKVVDYPLTPEQQAKLDKFRGLLWEKKTVKDLITDEEKETVEPSAVMRAYTSALGKYNDAVIEYNTKRVAAAGATGPEGKAASADWALNQQNYYLKVKAAADEWTSAGYRNEVDQMNAYISQTTERSMIMWKQSLLERFQLALISTPEVAIPFPYTTLVPGNIATSGGWTRIGISHKTDNWSKESEATSWKAGGGVNFGLFRFDAKGGRDSSSYQENHQVSEFSMTFEMAQAVIVRAGFYPEFFANRGWMLRKGEGWTFDDLPSDGQQPPHGSFVGYATQAVFVRNVEIKSRDFVSAYRDTKSKVTAGGGVGWGPWCLNADYSHESHKENFTSTEDGETLNVDGMQIIGFVNHLLGKAPNPLEDIPEEQFA
ncbi:MULTISPECIES: hypothetical protein [unclassified Gordonia (in: high G+C Gram-positive bacteria)]|uniref:hypothetical protein n=1 Tax=unclassified Gordonia (in: high G+C Gram-positive bacteria) TaxID=2657482 RepID=UPI001FFF7DD4|nr:MULTISPECIES: hypothetical protein [unclassified Gordonia (in: high G+C Gram-positive bacteria)]UQE76144.1 hypothetical protein MYK68_06010 [Gordonia sp. PP30]